MFAGAQATLKPVSGKPVKEEGQNLAAVLQRRGAELLKTTGEATARAAKVVKDGTLATVSDRRVQVTTASAAGGAGALGAAGATAGCVAGGAVGACLGLLPAIFTFGLSIPLFAALGGASGLILGGAAGSAAGLTGGSAAGLAAYTKRAEIGSGLARVQAWSSATLAKARRRAAIECAAAWELATAFCGWSKGKTVELAADKGVQVAAASAVGGAAVLGTGGGAAGLLAGGAVGAAVGVVPALFTFGLSIPFCAVVGGGCGLVTGTAAGSATGLALGGAGGYGFYSKREKIRSTAAWSVTYAKERASGVRARLTGSSGATGETLS